MINIMSALRIAILIAAFLPKLAFAAIAFDAATFYTGGSAATHTFSHTTSGSDRVLLVACHGADANFTVTYNGVSMTELYDGNPGSPFKHIAFYILVAPATGTHDVVITPSGSYTIAAGAVSYTGVDQTTPNDTIPTVTTGASTTPSITVTSASGDVVVDFVAVNRDDAATVGASQTARVNQGNGDEFVAMHISEEAGAGSVDMTWTLGGSTAWTQGAVNLNAAAGGASSIVPIIMQLH